MSNLKFIHAADIHLDSPLVGLQQYEGAPVEQIRGATRQALGNLVKLAVSEAIDFVLISGDLYDGDWKDFRTGLFFSAQMAKLHEAGIRVFLIKGNHDAASQITKQLRLPENVRVFSVQKPETVVLDELGIAIHGQGFQTRAVTSDLANSYPERIPGLFNIGLLHTCVDGREGHERYAPCTLNGLVSKGYDYWALGHVHKREILHRDPWVLFPGNIQGRHVKETGPKGATLVILRDGKIASIDHHDLDVLRWAVCEINVSGAKTGDEVLDLADRGLKQIIESEGDHPLAIRVCLRGSCKAHRELSADPEQWLNEVRSAATNLSNGKVWIERVDLQTETEISLEKIIQADDALGGLLRSIGNLAANEEVIAALGEEFGKLHRKIPAELRSGEDTVDLKNPETLRKIVGDVKQLLLTRLIDDKSTQ